MSGVFNRAPEPVAKKPDVQVLVAAKNLFAGDTIEPSGVRVRPLKAEEMEHYLRHKDDYLPPVQAAAFLRIAKQDIFAEQPILKQQLEEMAKPSALNSRLMANMRAVNLSIPRDNAAGGLIQVGDWVDVFLTSTIQDTRGRSTTRTAVIAPHARVVAKRNSLWPIFAPLPAGPVQFTLEMNPYRAALVEYGKAKGQLMLTPLPGSEQKTLEQARSAVLKGNNPDNILFAKDGDEARDEQVRVAAYNRGELVVDERDMVRIFGLATGEPRKLPEQKVVIEQLGGLNHYPAASFDKDSGKRDYPTKPGQSGAGASANATAAASAESPAVLAPGFQFHVPGTEIPGKDCPSCKERREKAKAAGR
jgi:Flp pilus assembly protein CpaB